MKHKRILIIGVLLLSLTFTGCQRGVVTSDSNINSLVSQSVSETSNEEPYKTVAVPEGGWTVEELAKTIRINGKPVEIPFTVESLGEDYQLDDNSSSWDENKKTLTSSLLYKGDPFMTVYISGVKKNSFKEARLSEVVRFGFFHTDNIDINKMLSINNIHIGSAKNHLKTILGEPNEIDGAVLIYKDRVSKSNIAVFWIYENEAVSDMFFTYKQE